MANPDSLSQTPTDGQRRSPLRLIVVVALIPLLLGAVLLFYAFQVANSVFGPMGPFVGKPAEIPSRSATHSYSLPNGVVLESYDSPLIGSVGRTVNDDAVVLARNPDGTIRWCIHASNRDGDDVDSVRFSQDESWNWSGYKVEGLVDWDHGVEWTGWYLSREGDLEEYYYSW